MTECIFYKENKKKMYAILCSITGLLFLVLITVKGCLFTDNLPFYWIIGFLLFLFAYELCSMVIVYKQMEKANDRKIVSLYMLLKGIKIIIFLATLFTYMLVINIENQRFAMIMAVIYFIYLLFNTFFLISMEKQLKQKRMRSINHEI